MNLNRECGLETERDACDAIAFLLERQLGKVGFLIKDRIQGCIVRSDGGRAQMLDFFVRG